MDSIHFLRPHMLGWFLIVIPSIVAVRYLAWVIRYQVRRLYGEEQLLMRFTSPLSLTEEIRLLLTWLIVFSLMLVAAAGPVRPDMPDKVRAGTVQVITVVDVSPSMAAEEYRPVLLDAQNSTKTSAIGPAGSRLDMVRSIIIKRIMPSLDHNELGVVTYSGTGFSLVELTDDYNAAGWVMKHWMKVGSAPGGGSDFAEGFKEALAMFAREDDQAKEKVIVLFSDGGFSGQEYELNNVLKELQKLKIKLVVVAVGSSAGATIPIYNQSGLLQGYRRDEAGNILTTSADETFLRKLARQTAGQYIRLSPDGKFNIEWASTLESARVDRGQANLYQLPLGAALLLLSLLSLRGAHRR